MIDGQLVKSAGQGDEEAFRRLYRQEGHAVFAYARRLLGSREAGEDVAQESFLVLLKRPEGFDPSRGPLRLYLFGIARRLIWKKMQSCAARNRLETRSAAEQPPKPVVDPQQLVLETELADRVRRAVLDLAPRQREAVVLFHYHQFSLREIGELTGDDPNTVKQRLFRARAALRRQLSSIHTGQQLKRSAEHG